MSPVTSASSLDFLGSAQVGELVAAAVGLLVAALSAGAIFLRQLGRRMSETRDAAAGTQHVASQWNGQTRDLLVNGLQSLVSEVQGVREEIRGLRTENTAMRGDLTSLRVEVRADLDDLRKRLHDHEADRLIHVPHPPS